jgi:pyrroline-5-carboxylate reductase
MVRLQLVGGGKMGEALLGGLLAASWCEPADVLVVEKVEARRTELAARYPGIGVSASIGSSDGAIVAVKPGDVPAVCTELAGAGVRQVLSIAAGITLATLEQALADGVPAGTDLPAVVRAMPNTPALVGAGASAIAGGTTATDADLDWAEGVLSAVGVVVRVPEAQLAAVTGLSGSGPAYVFLVAESLIEAGVLTGLPRPVSEQLAVQTLLGSALLLRDGGSDAATLRAGVTSPGGTTAAGLRALEDRAVRAAFLAAVDASARRSAELG